MKTEALIWMVAVQLSVTVATTYFFYKIFKTGREERSREKEELEKSLE